MPAPTCPECGRAVAADQRYCVRCGARLGAEPGVRAVAWQSSPEGAAWQAASGGAPAAGGTRSLPPPRVAAALVLAVLGFGVLVGAAVSPGVEGTLAAA